MCGFMCLFLFLYVSVWDESMTCSSSPFFPPCGSSSFCVCGYTIDPALLPTSLTLDICGVFSLFASSSFYTFLLYVCLYINPRVCVCSHVVKPKGPRQWQTAAPRRDSPARWNLGEELSGGRIIVRRWVQERARSTSTSRVHFPNILLYIARFLKRESEFDHSLSRKCWRSGV